MKKFLSILMVVFLIGTVVSCSKGGRLVNKLDKMLDEFEQFAIILTENKDLFTPEEYDKNIDNASLVIIHIRRALPLLKADHLDEAEEEINQAQNYLNKLKENLVSKNLLKK